MKMKVKKLNKNMKQTLIYSLLVSFIFLAWLHINFDFFYYTHSYDVRRLEFRDVHYLLRPSGDYGHGFGIIGSILIYIGLIYHLRKVHKKGLKKLGKIKYWLLIHVATSIVGSAMVLMHASAIFENWSGTITVILFIIAILSGFLITLFKFSKKGRKIVYWTHYYSSVAMLLSLAIHASYFIYVGFVWIF